MRMREKLQLPVALQQHCLPFLKSAPNTSHSKHKERGQDHTQGLNKPPKHTLAHIPTKAHIFCKTRSYSIILKSGMWGGIRSPESATQGLKSQGMSRNLPINELTVVSQWDKSLRRQKKQANSTVAGCQKNITHLAMESQMPLLSLVSLSRSSLILSAFFCT